MISAYSDAVAVTSDHELYIFFIHSQKDPVCARLPADPPELKLLPADVMCISWALSLNALFEPLVVFSRASLLYVYSVPRNSILGYLRGHGGAITSINVHPVNPHLFCTTSRDHSTRIYDLTLSPQQLPNNTHWPPSTKPSLAGAAHGLHMTEAEGNGIGRCVVVLMGGRSGGHQAAVLGAAFHPELPLIATCGLDRAVKIWVVRPTFEDRLKREDKPLFSSSRIHRGRVLSVTWLQHDLLLTHSGPALMRTYQDPMNKTVHTEPGELVIWRWLGIDRFFPPDKEDVSQDLLRGCASDYQESSSFKFVSVNAFPNGTTPHIAPNLSVYHSSIHDPVLLCVYPESSSFLMLNAGFLPARRPFPFPVEKQGLVSVEEDGEEVIPTARDDKDGGGDMSNVVQLPPEIVGWRVGLNDHITGLHNCVMGMGGQVIIGVGAKKHLWIWQLRERKIYSKSMLL